MTSNIIFQELHAHLNTSFSMKFLRELVGQNENAYGVSVEDLQFAENQSIDEYVVTLFCPVIVTSIMLRLLM